LGVAAAVVVAACADRVAEPLRVAPDPTSIATLVVTGSADHAGAIVTISAHLSNAAAQARAGAFVAHIEYDTSLVSFVDQGDAAGGIAAFHADQGVLRVAGASLQGYSGGVLFNARFKLTRVSPATELRLVIDQLRDVNLSDRLPPAIGARSAVARPSR
jgi:hypothetical protein